MYPYREPLVYDGGKRSSRSERSQFLRVKNPGFSILLKKGLQCVFYGSKHAVSVIEFVSPPTGDVRFLPFAQMFMHN